ncbi:hypothetical protein MTO96_043770 [Rhipicephalus appendiculatus]
MERYANDDTLDADLPHERTLEDRVKGLQERASGVDLPLPAVYEGFDADAMRLAIRATRSACAGRGSTSTVNAALSWNVDATPVHRQPRERTSDGAPRKSERAPRTSEGAPRTSEGAPRKSEESTEEERGNTEDERGNTEDERRSTEEERESPEDERGSTEHERGSTEDERESTEDERGSTEEERESTEEERESTEDERESTEDERESTGYERESTEEERESTEDERESTGYERGSTGVSQDMATEMTADSEDVARDNARGVGATHREDASSPRAPPGAGNVASAAARHRAPPSHGAPDDVDPPRCELLRDACVFDDVLRTTGGTFLLVGAHWDIVANAVRSRG